VADRKFLEVLKAEADFASDCTTFLWHLSLYFQNRTWSASAESDDCRSRLPVSGFMTCFQMQDYKMALNRPELYLKQGSFKQRQRKVQQIPSFTTLRNFLQLLTEKRVRLAPRSPLPSAHQSSNRAQLATNNTT
jgi:hypothetical protein